MLNGFSYKLPADLEAAVNAAISEWRSSNKIDRIWQKDASVWTGDDESKWLGWLDIVDEELKNVDRYRAFYDEVQDFESILLMGMGGSSLCPEVLARTFGREHFHILDSTDPAQIAHLEDRLDLTRTLFIVASKSGSTLEPNCFKQYFFERLTEVAGRTRAGRQFVAITDPGSEMEQVALDDGFRHIFYGKPEIGGRFSALSAFGMTAAASMGLMVDGFLGNAREMVNECRISDPEQNPGALLGLILGECHRRGRDKLTIFTSPAVSGLGAWLEQLVAESTGKNDVAIIPVDREPIVAPTYSDDRVFAFLSVGDDNRIEELYDNISAAGHPCVHIGVATIENLGQEFFRWEFATAVAGSLMGINPFNQPDVEAAKIEARKITDQYEQEGVLPEETPFFEDANFRFFGDPALGPDGDAGSPPYEGGVAAVGDPGRRGLSSGIPDSADGVVLSASAAILRSFLDTIRPHDYVAILAYIEMNEYHTELLQILREKVLAAKNVATCLGFGPRFLHSTGQAYKGGPNTGVFLQVTRDDPVDLPVPGQKYTFGIVKAAQARGDFQVLIDRGRRALRLHIKGDVTAGLERLTSLP